MAILCIIGIEMSTSIATGVDDLLVSFLFVSTVSQLLFFLYNVLLSFQKGNSFA